MNLYRQKVYELTHWSHEARALASILIRTYSNNHKIAYDILLKLPKNADRVKLLQYIDKKNMSKETVAKIVDTYLFYHVTLPNNKKYMETFQTNNFALVKDDPETTALLASHVIAYQTRCLAMQK